MIHTDGHSTIVSRGSCDECIISQERREAQRLVKLIDIGVLTEQECLEALSRAAMSGAELEPRHQRLLDALTTAGYLSESGEILLPLI